MHSPNIQNAAPTEPEVENNRAEENANHDFAAKLARAFIEFCAQDGEDSGSALTTKISAVNQSLIVARYELDKVTRIGESAKTNQNIGKALSDAANNLAETMISIQSIDRIVQRLTHASRIINELVDHSSVTPTGEPMSVADARRERLRLYNMLSMEDERAIFRAIEEGLDVRAAILAGINVLKQRFDSMDDNIEFF